MFIKSFNFTKDRGRKLWYILIFALTVASILIAISFYILNTASSSIKIEKSNKNNIFKLSSYYTEYTVNIKSNKNTNIYNMKEWYSINANNNLEKFKFETTNDTLDTITYLIENNKLTIKNSSEIYEYILSEYIVSKKNVLSISTFIDIYNKIKQNTLNENICCKVENISQDKICSYKIIFGNNLENCEICKMYNEINDLKNNISSIEVLVNEETSLPTEMFIYDKSGNVYIDITYNVFKINSIFE